MASIERITTAAGEPRYRVRWRADGRLVERWARTSAAAKAIRTEVEAAALIGAAPDPRAGAVVLNAYFATWLDGRLVRGRPLSPSTRIGYERLWRRNLAESIGRRQLRAIDPGAVRAWHGDVAGRAGFDQAAKSYRLLRAVLGTAEADELIRVNPCKVRAGGQERRDERPMLATSMVLELADAIDERYRALVLLAGFGGLRTGESLGLVRGDVDPLHSTVHVVRQAVELTGNGRTVMPPKSEAGRRDVVVPSIVVEALLAHLDRFTEPDADAPVFTGPTGTPLRRATLSKAWRAACRTVGAPEGLRMHDLRHHAATLTARMPGVTTKELMSRIGHASPRAALLYQHATAERDRAIASFLDEQIAAAEAPARADVVGLRRAARGAGVGLAT